MPLSGWTVVGVASNIGPGLFQFTSQPTTNDPQRYYTVQLPIVLCQGRPFRTFRKVKIETLIGFSPN